MGGSSQLGKPFGYLKLSSVDKKVYFYILPYNYQILSDLMWKFKQIYKGNPPNEWIGKFAQYLHAIPYYYHNILYTKIMKSTNDKQLPV